MSDHTNNRGALSLYLFGGATNLGSYNDLWKFDGSQWSWIAGSASLNQFESIDANSCGCPGARSGAVAFYNQQGHLLLFGGDGYSSTSEGLLNDFWSFNGTTWRLLGGSITAVNQPGLEVYLNSSLNLGQYGTLGVSSNYPGSRMGAAWASSQDKYYLFGGLGMAHSYGNTLTVFD